MGKQRARGKGGAGASPERSAATLESTNLLAHYQHISAAIPGVVFQVLRDSQGKYHVPFITEKCAHYLGLSAAEIAADPFRLLECMPEAREDELKTAVSESARIMTDFTAERRVVRPDGKIFWLRAEAAPRETGDGGVIWNGAAIDVTSLKLAETELQEQSRALTQRIKALDCLYGVSRLMDDPALSFDRCMQETADLIPRAWRHPDAACARIRLKDKTFRSAPFQEGPWRQSADIVVGMTPNGVVEVFYADDVSDGREDPFQDAERSLLKAVAERLGKMVERRKATIRLQKSESQYRMLAEQVTDGIALVQEGEIIFVNQAFRTLFGYDASDDLIGKDPIDFIEDDFKTHFLENHDGLALGLSENQTMNCKCIRKDGGLFWVEAGMNRIEWKGRPAVLSAVRDITARKREETNMREISEFLREENIRLRSSIRERYRFGDIIGKSRPMQGVYELILKAAASDAAVLIYGASGTGKELAAQSIHRASKRRDREFVPVNCGAIPEAILEREFFGHKKGAFTGAEADIHGYLDLADGGTLFLDEIGELTLNMQAKLLRVLDSGTYLPVGSNRTQTSHFRLIAATNRSLEALVNAGRMREDFYYRIHVIPINLPPLKERREDIPLLIDHFLSEFAQEDAWTVPAGVMEKLYHHDWPGNVRELKNVLYRYAALNQVDFLDARGAPVRRPVSEMRSSSLTVETKDLSRAVAAFEKQHILKALEQTRWHRGKTAGLLNLPPRTLYRKMKKYRLI